MTDEQKVAYVIAQSVAALAEIKAMDEANYERNEQDKAHAYGEEEYRNVATNFGLHHNQIMKLFYNT